MALAQNGCQRGPVVGWFGIGASGAVVLVGRYAQSAAGDHAASTQTRRVLVPVLQNVVERVLRRRYQVGWFDCGVEGPGPVLESRE